MYGRGAADREHYGLALIIVLLVCHLVMAKMAVLNVCCAQAARCIGLS